MSKGPTLLILGGTSEARALANAVSEAGIDALYSYAGRTASPVTLPIPTRVGGFGGAEGLAGYIRQVGFTHVVDATHPFAAKMSHNAAAACEANGTPLIALVRPPWQPELEDIWIHAPDMESAVASLATDPQRVFLAIGKKEVVRFKAQPQHHYLLRVVDPPKSPPPLPNHEIVVARGPFDIESDRRLLEQHEIGLVISKNAGGAGAYAKIAAARQLGLPVVMIDRPDLPERREVGSVADVLDWIAHSGTDLGV